MPNTNITLEVARYIADKGIALTVVSEKTGIPYNVVYNSLGPKAKRDLRAGEYLDICLFLDIDPKRFHVKKAG